MTFATRLRNYLVAAGLPALPGSERAGAWIKAVDEFWTVETNTAISEAVAKVRKERKRASVADGAEQVYAIFPKHVGRDDALRAITKALKNHPLEYLLDKTNQFREAVESWPTSYRYFQDGGDRCPHPTTWFNQGRFQDDPREWARKGARTPPNRPGVSAPQPTQENALAHAELLAKYRSMPEPERGTLNHSLWLEAQRASAVETMVEATSALPFAVEDEQRLRKA
jgi:hypothetical protein